MSTVVVSHPTVCFSFRTKGVANQQTELGYPSCIAGLFLQTKYAQAAS